MPDVVAIDGLSLKARVGVHPHEKRIRQTLVVSIRITTALAEAGEKDDVDLTVDYDRVAELTRDVVARKHYDLIEAVAETLAKELLSELGDKAEEVWIRVEKPGAVFDARTVAVEITRDASP